jgi:hypothetical protein
MTPAGAQSLLPRGRTPIVAVNAAPQLYPPMSRPRKRD